MPAKTDPADIVDVEPLADNTARQASITNEILEISTAQLALG